MIAAPVAPDRVAELRALLATMTIADHPGMAAPSNPLVPFGRFTSLHVARFVVVEDTTLPDLPAYGVPEPSLPIYLVFLGDCDGPASAMLDTLVAEAGPGLRRIFGFCKSFDERTELGPWMRAHAVASATEYTNWMGRTVLQIREEAALHAFLRAQLTSPASRPASPEAEGPRVTRDRLRTAVAQVGLRLTPARATPLAWQMEKAFDLVRGLVVAAIVVPLLVLASPLLLLVLRGREKNDPVIAPPPARAHVQALEAVEDHDVTNGFSAVGSLKPGRFRLALMVMALAGLNFTTRHIYTRGRLARVGTIHFARWVFLDGRRRMLFASNYDGGLETYMDDFINKAGFGLNLVFSNGVGYPRTRFILAGGAKEEQQFKNFLRRHQLPTDVWYKAYPGITTADMARNARVREGFERANISDAELRRWLALI